VLVKKAAAMAIDLRLRRLFIGCCFIALQRNFVVYFELVAFFNFAKNSLFINFGLFDNGIYVP
jgi:hypothetical protein